MSPSRPAVRVALLTAVVLFTALVSTAISPVRAAVHAGDEAPDFTKTQLGGGEVSLSDYAGQVVVLFLLGYG